MGEIFEDFVRRHIGPDVDEQQQLLQTLGFSELNELTTRIVPDQIRANSLSDLPNALTESQALTELRAIARKNRIFKNYLGMGYYGTHTPSVIQRNVLENPAWYTAYTPYQSEISQGRLEALLNYQTMVCELTAMDIANASLLDEATAAAEAMLMCRRASTSSSRRFSVSDQCHPQTIAVLRTRAEPLGIELHTCAEADLERTEAFGYLVQYPGTSGGIFDYSHLTHAAHAREALVTVSADLLALSLLKPPGEMGADICVGTTQRFGVPMAFGGPHAAYLACKEKYRRTLPGRLVGVSRDSKGKPAYRLTLSTREQHIRREKATSNICTAQALLAIVAAMYAIYHGPDGLRAIARRIANLAFKLHLALISCGFRLENESAFDTVTVVTGAQTAFFYESALARAINLRRLREDALSISIDETTTEEDLVELLSIFGAAMPSDNATLGHFTLLPPSLARSSSPLKHPVFRKYRSETNMLRYLRALSDKDLALDRTMIPLGSCTMKLNATTEMLPISWPEFASIHPYAPTEQVQGYLELIKSLEQMLAICTGFDAVSLQPNSGAQGEYAGLLTIRAYHQERGEPHRNIVLIPASAHGTNPASAALAGMTVVIIPCDESGNVNVLRARELAREHADRLAALMVTYPSTHGVFEEGIVELCRITHEHGGQVYLDGANMNALVGLSTPRILGADVCHLNLHKTFCIPHGGGGPGVGPIAVRKHLAPFLPNTTPHNTASRVGMVSAAPYGSAGILPITWTYIAMMGASGLRRATEVALLNANYIAARLQNHYPILYRGKNGLVAHECILDLRPIKACSGITNEDVAKRLIDYGFHAPTMSFPVPGTLMVEPTESESKEELDRFIEAMISIRLEIAAIEEGRSDRIDNPLKNAPHTAVEIAGDGWSHAYSRMAAAYPAGLTPNGKYWAPVSRVDDAYGDKNLFCSCPPINHYQETASTRPAESAMRVETHA